MNTNRIRNLALAAALGLTAFGAIAARALPVGAQSAQSSVAVVQAQDCAANQADDATEVNGAASTDTDQVDLQCGDQNASDTAEAASVGPDTDTVQEGEGQQIEDGQPDFPGAALEDGGK